MGDALTRSRSVFDEASPERPSHQGPVSTRRGKEKNGRDQQQPNQADHQSRRKEPEGTMREKGCLVGKGQEMK